MMLKPAFALLLLVMFAVGLLPAAFPFAAAPPSEVSILFTHDMHAHFDPERFSDNGVQAERGGFARMKAFIDIVKEQYPGTFLLDAGDFSMGTPYQTIYASEAPDLRMMGLLGYDAVTLGNHEFDYRAQGLTDMLHSALASGDRLPAITLANIDWDRVFADEGRAGNGRLLKSAMDGYGVADYLMIEKGDVRAAVFGINGKQSDSYAPESGLYFKDQIETAKATVAKINSEGSADIIICLSHGGVMDDPKKSEDELLAKAVPEIDVIVSGHMHKRFEHPIAIGDTIIISSGEHTYDIGHIVLRRDGDRYTVASYELIPIRENIPKDAEAEAAILKFRELVDQQYLSTFGYSFDQPLAHSPYEFTPIERFGKAQGEEALGNIIADSYIDAVKRAEGSNYRNVDVAVAPYGVIRGSFTEGIISVADAFNVSSLGIGPDGVPGYPLVSLYLTGRELKTVAEIDISVSPLMSPARLYISGLTYTYNTNRLLLNRVTDVRLMDMDGNVSELDNNKLYRIVGGLYSCQMLGSVESQSFGILKVTPKDAYGVPVTDFEQHIIYNGGVELKEWVALADYLASFPSVNGIPTIPEYYGMLQGRKVEETGKSPAALLKSPNMVFFTVLGAVLFILAILILVPCFIVRKVRRRRRNEPPNRHVAVEPVGMEE